MRWWEAGLALALGVALDRFYLVVVVVWDDLWTIPRPR